MASGLSTQINGNGAMGTLPDFRTFPPDDLLGLFTCQRGYIQEYKTSQIASVAICGRSCHIMPVLIGLYVQKYLNDLLVVDRGRLLNQQSAI